MAKSKRPRDFNQRAKDVVDSATSKDDPIPKTADGKNADAVALGRAGGLKGGPARAAKLSAARRSEIAKQAAEARWKNKKTSPGGGATNQAPIPLNLILTRNVEHSLQSTKLYMTVMEENDISQKLLDLFKLFKARMITVDEVIKRLADMRLYGTLIGDEPGRYAFVFNKYTIISEGKASTDVKIWFHGKHWKGSARAAIRFTIYEYIKELNEAAKEGAAKFDSDFEDLGSDDEE